MVVSCPRACTVIGSISEASRCPAARNCCCPPFARSYPRSALEVASEWDLHTGKQLRTFGGHGDFIWAVAVQGSSLFTASSECVTRQWSLDTGSQVRQFQPDSDVGPESHVWSIATTEKHLYTGDSEGFRASVFRLCALAACWRGLVVYFCVVLAQRTPPSATFSLFRCRD